MRYTPIVNPRRNLDAWGDGIFGATRGASLHKGRDYQYAVGEEVRSPVDGTVTKIGLPYANDTYRYVEILSSKREAIFRLFYVTPTVTKGQKVISGQRIGFAQDLTRRYNQDMTNHIHVECIVDPAFFFDNVAPQRGGSTWV